MVYKKPKADFNYTVAACADQVLVNFRSLSAPYTRVAWDFGTGYYESSSSAPAYTFPDTGRYMVKHIGFNGGCSDTIIKEIYANVLPKYVRVTRVSPQVCTGTRGEITFDQSSFRASGLLWNFGDGSTQPYDTGNHKVTHTYTRSGRYNITLTGSSNACPLQHTAGTVVLLKQKPVLTVSAASICRNQPVTMTITGLETNPYTSTDSWSQQNYQYSVYKYEYEDGTPFTGSVDRSFLYNRYSASMSGLKTGDIRIRAIITSNYLNCYDTTNYVSVKVNGPTAAFRIPVNDVCWKSPLAFEDASLKPTNTPITSWRWTFGDGKTEIRPDGGDVSHLYTAPGTYTVYLLVTDAEGCVSSASGTAIVRGPRVAFTPSGLYVPDVPLNTTVTFNNYTNVANSPGVTYQWHYGNGVTGNGSTGVQTYPVAGDYTIKLTATDPATGCADEDSTDITVRDFNTAFKFNATYLGSSSCPPVQVRITNLSVNATSYSWDFGDGFRVEGPATPSHTYTTPGKKVITLYSQGYNNLKGIYRDSIIIEESSAVMEADVLTGCTGQVVNLRAHAEQTSAYLWDFGDGTVKQTTTDPFYKHTYLSGGIYTPKVMVRDAKGCGHVTGIPEKIIIDSLRVSLGDIPEHLCQYTDNTFTPAIYSLAEAAAGETLAYQWNYGTGGDGSSGREGGFTYNVPGPYTIRLTVSSPYGCVKEDSRQVEVHEKFGLELDAPSQLDVCKGNSVPVVIKGGYSYEWIGHTEGISNTRIGNPLARPETDATYAVVGYDRWKCSSDTAQVKITVRPLPVVNAGPDAEVVANMELPLQAGGSDDVIRWAWTPADYLSCTNCTAPVARPKRTMQYVLTGTTSFNCMSRDTVLVKSLCLNGFIYIPNSFTPDGDGNNDRFYIKGKGIGSIRLLQVFNRWGEKMFERKHFDIDDPSVGWDGMRNGRRVPPGSYVYMAEMRCAEDGAVIVKRGTVTVIY